MSRSFDNVDYKVAEAEYFLQRLRTPNCLHPEIDFLLSAFSSAARSVTFSLYAVLSGLDGFDQWYAIRRERLKADPIARYFVELRNQTQKTGASVVNRMTGPDALVRFIKDAPYGRKNWFGDSGEDMPKAPDMEVGEAALTYFMVLLEIVYECYIDFGPVIDPQQHYTPEHYMKLGKTVEDAEEELGFPRGWTAIGRNDPADIPYRFEALRTRAAGVCGINHIFSQYLGRTTPCPRRLPEWKGHDTA